MHLPFEFVIALWLGAVGVPGPGLLGRAEKVVGPCLLLAPCFEAGITAATVPRLNPQPVLGVEYLVFADFPEGAGVAAVAGIRAEPVAPPVALKIFDEDGLVEELARDVDHIVACLPLAPVVAEE